MILGHGELTIDSERSRFFTEYGRGGSDIDVVVSCSKSTEEGLILESTDPPFISLMAAADQDGMKALLCEV